MTPTTDTLEDVLTRAAGVLSLVGDVFSGRTELTEASKDGLALIALEAASKVQHASHVLPAAVQRSLTVWGDRAACLAEVQHAVEIIEQHGTGRGPEIDAPEGGAGDRNIAGAEA